MANILLTTSCNLSCTYCFAQEKMAGKPRQYMSMENVTRLIEFLKSSDYPMFRMMGGEPTLHPQFEQIVTLALAHGFQINVLSNSTWSPKYNDLFRRISPNRIVFLLNIDHPDNYLPKQWQRIEQNLSALAEDGKSVTLSFNIFEKKPRYEYIFDLTQRYQIKTIRLSFSLPVLDVRNTYLPFDDYFQLSPFIVEFVHEAEDLGVTVRLDNAVPLCIFSHEQAGELILKGVLDLDRNSRCEPIIDIGPDLSVWCCFCLSKLENRHIDDFENLDEAREFYSGVMALYQDKVFPVDNCHDCYVRELFGCQGGCLSYAIMKHGERTLEGAAIRDGASTGFPNRSLTLSPRVSVKRYELPHVTYVLSEPSSEFQMEMDESFGALWPLLDGRFQRDDVIEAFLGQTVEESNGSPFQEFSRAMMREGLKDLLDGWVKHRILDAD